MSDGLRPAAKTPRKGRFSLGDASGALGLLAFAASWLTTLHFPPWVSWHAEALSFLAAGLVAAMAISRSWSRNPAEGAGVPRLVIPFVLLGAVATIQLATGVMTFGGDVLVIWMYATLCIACLVLGFNADLRDGTSEHIEGRGQAASLLAGALVAIGLASVALAFAQVFSLWEDSGWIVRMLELRRPGANIAQPNQLATLLVMGAASIAYLHMSGRIGGPAAVLIMMVFGAGISATESRSGALAVAVLLIWWQAKRRAVAPNVSAWAGPLLGLAFLLMFIGFPKLMNALDLFNVQVDNRFTQGDVRLAVWAQLVEAVMQRPWWGWGILEVAEAHNAVAHASPVNNAISYSHNLVLDWAVWMGLPIATGLVLAAGIWMSRRLAGINSLLPWYCIAASLPLATHSMLEFPFAYAYFLVPVMFLLGILERHMGARSVVRIGPRVAAALLVPISGVFIWSAIEYLSIEEDFRVVRFENLRLGKTPAGHHQPDVVLLTQLGALLSGSRIELRPAMPQQDLELLRNLAMRYPWVATQYRYAIALALNGNEGEAVRQLQVLRSLRGEKLYRRIRAEIVELGQTRYPQLRTLPLP